MNVKEAAEEISSAVFKNNVEIIRYWIQIGFDLNSMTFFNGTTVLHKAMRSNLNIIELLVDSGMSIHALDIRGNTPLFQAVLVNNKEAVEYLLDKGAKFTFQNYLGDTIAHDAASWHRVEILKIFLKRDPDIVQLKDFNGDTLLDRALAHKPSQNASAKDKENFKKTIQLLKKYQA